MYQTMYEQCATLSKAKRREIVTTTSLKPEGGHEEITFLVTNPIFVSALALHQTKGKKKKKKQKRQRPKHPKVKGPQ